MTPKELDKAMAQIAADARTWTPEQVTNLAVNIVTSAVKTSADD